VVVAITARLPPRSFPGVLACSTASSESVRRAKQLQPEGCHPLLLAAVKHKTGGQVDMQVRQVGEGVRGGRPSVLLVMPLQLYCLALIHCHSLLLAWAFNRPSIPFRSQHDSFHRCCGNFVVGKVI